MRRSPAAVLGLGLGFLALLVGSALAPGLFAPGMGPATSGPHGAPGAPVPPGAAASAAGTSAPAPVTPAAAPGPVPATSGPARFGAKAGWHNNSNFFEDATVDFFGTGLEYGFREVPYVNTVATSDLGFGVTVTASASLLFANLTIWGNSWPGTNLSAPIAGFSPAAPAVRPMVINASDPAQASFFFDNYRFFWPGSIVSFNITLVGKNSTPSEIKSASNVSVTENYPGGFQDAATWIYQVASPWPSANFSNDIAVTTTPNVLGSSVYAPNPRQSLMVSLSAIPYGGTVSVIPSAELAFTVDINGSVTAYSQPFGPVNHSQMSLVAPIGPYPGATVSFNVTAWLPWQGGAIDRIESPQSVFTWSSNGGWWHPLGGLLANLDLATSPALPLSPTPSTSPTPLPTAQPVTVTIHEPIENVTIASASAVYTYTDQSGSDSGTVALNAVTDNTSSATFPGLPPGGRLTFYLEAKDIYGATISSGNYSYVEGGPTNPPLSSVRGLLYVEFLDLSTGHFVTGFPYTVSNASWTANGTANYLGFATPLLPTSPIPVELFFGSYHVVVQAFGGTQSATIQLSPDTPTPVVVFFGESHPAPVVPTGTISPESIVAAGGLIAAAIITLPLVNWFGERRAQAEEEQRRITL